jgi:hypothetical protein
MNAGTLVGFTLTNGHTFATGGDWNHDLAGGGLNLSGSAIVSNCVIVGCSASHGGGVKFVGAGTLEKCTVQNCRSDGQGGGLYFNVGGTASRCIVRGNRTSSDNGGGAYLYGGGLAQSSLFVQNTAASSGGGALLDTGGTLENCTVVSNTCPNSGGGVYVWQSGTNLNTIIQYNTATGTTSNYTAGATGVFKYCCTTPLVTGAGNITAAPLFVGGGDYRLQVGSPCINTGTNAYAQGATDLDGNPRIIGGVVDMGAYESTSGSTTNGIRWAWLLKYGLATDGSADQQQADSDTVNNLQEYIADTDPTNPASYFCVTAVSNLPPWTVCFQSSTGRLYTLNGISNLVTGVWTNTPGAGPRPGTGGADALSDTNVPPKGPFYRLKVELP